MGWVLMRVQQQLFTPGKFHVRNFVSHLAEDMDSLLVKIEQLKKHTEGLADLALVAINYSGLEGVDRVERLLTVGSIHANHVHEAGHSIAENNTIIGIGHVSIKVDPATKNCSITNLQWLIHVCQSLYSKVST